MSAIPFSTLESYIWDTILDTDSANRSFDETTLLRLLNKNYCAIKGIVDDRVYDLSATTSGLTVTAAAPKVTLSVGYIRRILEVIESTGAGTTVAANRPLSRVEPWELQRVQFDYPDLLDGTTNRATVYACWRVGTATAADVGKWAVGTWAPLDASKTYMLRVLKEPTALTNADTPDLDDAGCYALADMTAAVGARLIGRSEEEIADIKARIPDGWHGILGRVETELGLTKARPQEQPA